MKISREILYLDHNITEMGYAPFNENCLLSLMSKNNEKNLSNLFIIYNETYELL